jgi:hypothetical protein
MSKIDFTALQKKAKPKPKPKQKQQKQEKQPNVKKCAKCGVEFTPGKFTPYQKFCKDCRKGGKNAPKHRKAKSGGYVVTNCNVCGQSIRIRPDTMTAHCLDHCSQEERKIRLEMVQESMQQAFDDGSEPVDKLFANSRAEYSLIKEAIEDDVGVTIEQFSDAELRTFPFTPEVIWMWLLARGFKMSRTGYLFKEYGAIDNLYVVSLSPPKKSRFCFCISYNIVDRFKKDGKSITQTRKSSEVIYNTNFTRIPKMPKEILEDIKPLLELAVLKGKNGDE